MDNAIARHSLVVTNAIPVMKATMV